jgi:UDP-N-acetylmuramate dehydrogenase
MTNLLIHNAFKLDIAAKQIISIESLEDALSLSDLHLDCYLVLGSATNMIMSEIYDGTIITVSMSEIEQISEDITSVGAGLSWDKLVSYCIDNNLYGIENLTLIPGSVGAAPVQNIGAYGVEVSSVIESVTCYNFSTKQVEILSNADCKFSYRQSIFQTKTYLILSVQFRFSKVFSPNLSYPSLLQFLEQESINHDSLSSRQLSSAIQSIRESKLPSLDKIPNVGSIFKNPIVNSDSIDLDFLSGHRWELSEGKTKLSAARLLETVMPEINIPPSLGFYEKHSLVLINRGGAVFNEIIELLKNIQDEVHDLYGIDLEIEPEIVGS